MGRTPPNFSATKIDKLKTRQALLVRSNRKEELSSFGTRDEGSDRYDDRNRDVSLDVPFDPAMVPRVVDAFKTTGLHRAPLTGGMKNASSRFDLPPPPVAVRNLIEHSHFGHLCTKMSGMHHRRNGYPFGTLVDFATDGAGYPILCLSPLSIHSRNIVEEPRCSLVIQMLGWTGLANARATIFGDVYQLPPSMQEAASELFFKKHSNDKEQRLITGNEIYYRMNKITDVYFVGGFGTVQWIHADDYLSHPPDDVVILTDEFANDLMKLVATNPPVDDIVNPKPKTPQILTDEFANDLMKLVATNPPVDDINLTDEFANDLMKLVATNLPVDDIILTDEFANDLTELVATNPPVDDIILTDEFANDLIKLVATNPPVDDIVFIAIDANGTDVRVRTGSEFNICRFNFENKESTKVGLVVGLEEAKVAMALCVKGMARAIALCGSRTVKAAAADSQLRRWNNLENNPEFQHWANVGLAAAYGLIALVALIQLGRIQMRVPEYGWTTQKVFHLFNCLVCGIRCAIFLFRPQVESLQPPILKMILLDLPGILLVLFWAEIYHQARSLPTSSLRPAFIGLNVAVMVVQAGFWVSSAQAPSPERQQMLYMLSELFLVFISLLAATGFLLYGGRLYLMLHRFPIESRGRRKKLKEVGMVTCICASCFLLRAAIISISAVDRVELEIDILGHPVLNVLYYSLVEILPAACVLYILRKLPPKRAEGYQQIPASG
eukprot:gene20184-26922_t